MPSKHHVVLIPGFFGFAHLGGLRYFVNVRETLERAFSALGVDVHVTELVTLPTSSIRHRAARVLDALRSIAAESDAPMHVVGHSTGGLDARLAVAPTAALPTEPKFDAIDHVHSIVTVSTPHYGTPIATAYGSVLGKPLLRLTALNAIRLLKYGHIPLGAALKVGELVVRLDDFLGLRKTIVDEIYDTLLSDFSRERRKAVADFLENVSSDQSLIFQLTPEAIDLFNATSADPMGVRYGSVLTRAQKFGWHGVKEHSVHPYAQSMHLLFAFLYAFASRAEEASLPRLSDADRAWMRAQFGDVPLASDNDGLVPTLSQLWGEKIHATWADHMDVAGHFGDRGATDGSYADWLPSSSGFGREKFDRLWREVARFIAEEALRHPTRISAAERMQDMRSRSTPQS